MTADYVDLVADDDGDQMACDVDQVADNSDDVADYVVQVANDVDQVADDDDLVADDDSDEDDLVQGGLDGDIESWFWWLMIMMILIRWLMMLIR